MTADHRPPGDWLAPGLTLSEALRTIGLSLEPLGIPAAQPPEPYSP